MECARHRCSASVPPLAGPAERPPSTESTEEGFRKLFAAVADPQTQELHQRHLALTKNVLYQNELGWKLAELPLVNDLLVLLRDKVLDGVEAFDEQLLAALELCSRPFLRQKSNEEISNPTLLVGIVPTLAQLLSFHLVDVQVAAATALYQFAIGACLSRPSSKTKSNNLTEADDLRTPTRVFCQNLMEETDTIDLLVAVFHDLFPDDEEPDDELREQVSKQVSHEIRPLTPSTATDDPSGMGSELLAQRASRLDRLLFPLVELVHELSSNQRCAEVLVVTGALHYIVFLLDGIASTQDELLPLCLTTLWNVLELCEDKMKTLTTCSTRRELLIAFRLRNATYFLSNEFTLQTLLKTLERLLMQGYRRQDKEMRNECILIFMLLAKRVRSLELFHTSGLTTCLLTYATASEFARKKTNGSNSQNASSTALGSAIVADFHHYATNSDEDLEFKQSVWLLLSIICAGHEGNLHTLVQFRFLDVLLNYATMNEATQQHRKTLGATTKNPSKTASAQTYSQAQLQLLQTTALTVLNSIGGLMLEHFVEINGHRTMIEFLHARNASEEIQAAVWMLFLQLTPSERPIQDALGHLGALELALSTFQSPPSRHTFMIRRDAILVCSQLCWNNEENRRRFFAAKGVTSVVRYLEYDSAQSVLHENILVGIIEAVRACIIGHSDSELAFLRADGVLRLLDIVETAPKVIRNQALAALAEICVNPGAIPSYAAWRSERREASYSTANQMLLRIYADEEAVEDKQQQQRSESDAEWNLVSSTNQRSSAFQSITTCKSPFVIYADGTNPAEDTASMERSASPAFARLKEALKAAQTLATGSHATSPRSLFELQHDEFHPQLNLKAKIHSVLANMSFNCPQDVEMTAKELVMIEIAKEYPTFQIGEMWQNVELTLHAEGVRPIYADALYIRRQIEEAYNIAVCTKNAQQEVVSRELQGQERREQSFYEGILRQKQQEEQVEAFHRANRRQNSTMKLHLDAKRTRLEFMKKQDPTAFAAYEREMQRTIQDPPPVYMEELSSVAQKEKELRGRLSTIVTARSKY
ncbi:hypothetical protein Poli38472_005796 [Pythium oligandrum]|uniref:Cilia- and flagella-associated protein 69 ARM repeats domain-containing protein n=1 Tax=Pythium oligandrum TaxID=41045 RepID=A0A8K1CSW3_PYTOL|nr:hypothetical protein Poli38472_005796 [Pythium oligandrum]|eukprot:TMW68328.1 hypothetical protein Poli38472_005796 [Pythium oligandrum]